MGRDGQGGQQAGASSGPGGVMTPHSTDRICIDDPIFWHEFLKRLSFDDTVYDAMVIASLCKTLHVPPERVLAKMKAYMHFADASTAEH
jgi:hypothetical protein